MKIGLKHLAFGVLMAFILAELATRASGIGDFPLYDANNHIGYIPKPSQSGSFLNTRNWAFNSLSMGGPEFMPSAAVDTLLIGDSVVLGGNPYRQDDRLGPQLQRQLGQPVWPISAGSWALRNELIYLGDHPEVVAGVDRIVFVLNSGDFAEASSWACETTHPRSRPVLLTFYLFRKYVYGWPPCGTPHPDLTVPPGDWKPEIAAFFAHTTKEVAIFLYPNKAESGDTAQRERELEMHAAALMAGAGAKPIRIYSIGRDRRWQANYYRDDIHPTVDGIRVLADIIKSPDAAAWIVISP